MPDVESSGGVGSGKDRREVNPMCGTFHISDRLGFLGVSDAETNNGIDNCESSTEALRNNIVSTFQFTTNTGSLCDEPLWTTLMLSINLISTTFSVGK